MIELGNILRAAGLTVSEVLGWRTRAHPGSFAPVGGLWHHTAGNKDLNVVVNGRPDLAGPLAHCYLDRAGVWHTVSAGVAWHAGPGSAKRLADIRAGVAPKGDAAALGLPDDSHQGNNLLLGVEVEGGLPGEAYPDAQIRSLVAGTAAFCREFGWTENHWAHHREWTARKPDMSYRGDLRGAVRALLTPPASPLLKVGATGQRVIDVQHALDKLGNHTAYIDGLGKFGAETYRVLCVFQRHTPRPEYPHKLKVTGTTDPATWAALRAVAHPPKGAA